MDIKKTSGGQIGNQSSTNATSIKDAIRYALANYSDNKIARGQALKAIITDIVKEAIAGDWKAREFIVERTEGKAAQHVTISDNRTLNELTEHELYAIASGNGTVSETDSEKVVNQVH